MNFKTTKFFVSKVNQSKCCKRRGSSFLSFSLETIKPVATTEDVEEIAEEHAGERYCPHGLLGISHAIMGFWIILYKGNGNDNEEFERGNDASDYLSIISIEPDCVILHKLIFTFCRFFAFCTTSFILSSSSSEAFLGKDWAKAFLTSFLAYY